MTRLQQFWRGDRALSTIVETIFMVMLLLGVMGGCLAYGLALYARSAVVSASYGAARVASIECDPANPSYSASWPTDTVTAASQSLSDSRLVLKSFADVSVVQTPGDWYVASSCTGGVASVEVEYNQLDVMPVLGELLLASDANGPLSFSLTSGAQFPVER